LHDALDADRAQLYDTTQFQDTLEDGDDGDAHDVEEEQYGDEEQ